MKTTLTRLAPLAALAAAFSCAAPDGDPPLEQADPETLTWIAPRPDATATTGDAFELSVYTANAAGTVVHFAIDGREVGACDATHVDLEASDADCFEEGFYRFTTRVTAVGSHVASAWFTDGATRVDAARAFEVTATPPTNTTRPMLSLDGSDILDGTVSGAGEIDAEVSAEHAASLTWQHRGEFSYAVSSGRIATRANDGAAALVEVGSADEVSECMETLGGSIERAAQTHHVDAAALIALAMVRSECSPDEPGGPMRMPYARCAVLANISPAACDARLRIDPDFAIDLAARDLASARVLHENDPVVAGVVFVTGGFRASTSNRWQMATPPEFVDDYVRAYNAVRSWRSDAPETPSCPAGTSCAIQAIRARAHNPCHGAHPGAIHATPGMPTHGTAGNDVIIGTNGDDDIDGGGGNDIICGRGGNDHLNGGADNDFIDGGGGRDTMNGDDGDDEMYGRNGGDLMHGGNGNDLIVAGVLDDDLYGDAGNDVLIGGHGIDFMNGGEDNDWLRGDTGYDTFVGGLGTDTASFETAFPPGDPLSGGPVAVEGVSVSINAHLASNDRHIPSLVEHGMTREQIAAAGLASGDAVDEVVAGIERYAGSPYNDSFDVAGADVIPTSGDDRCNGAACAGSFARPMGPFVYLTGAERDNGLVVIGSRGVVNDAFHLSMSGGAIHVTMPATATPTPGPGCHRESGHANVIVCDVPNSQPLRFIAGYGDAGDDRFVVGDGIPPFVEIHLNGGDDNDYLRGNRNDDVLFSGPTGEDHLYGRGGDDALLSESSPADRRQLDASSYGGGRDFLFAGAGDDQLVSDYPCGNHEFHGGRGTDIAGFRRSEGGEHGGIRGQFGGPVAADHRFPFHGRAFAFDRCGYRVGTHLHGDLEIFETSTGNDEVYGDDRRNTFWTWDGNDVIYGFGNDDGLYGMLDDDQMYGGDGDDELVGQEGRDSYYGGAGFDRIVAGHDSMDRDEVIDCGGNGGRLVSSDSVDPNAQSCMP